MLACATRAGNLSTPPLRPPSRYSSAGMVASRPVHSRNPAAGARPVVSAIEVSADFESSSEISKLKTRAGSFRSPVANASTLPFFDFEALVHAPDPNDDELRRPYQRD